jgi:hypothetical protein|nr:MAG TPA: tail protein [Caudoviricetes sp.]
MLETTQEYRSAITSDVRVIHASFTLNGRTYDQSHLKKIEYDASISGGSSFVPGGTFINSLSVELNQIVEGIEEMMPSTSSIGVQTLNGQVAMLPLGRFFVTEIKLDRNSKITKLKLQDEFVRLLGPYESKLSYPTGTREIFQEIVMMTGISVSDAINLPNVSIKAKLGKTTFRDAIMYLAQLNGTFARFNRDGKLDFIDLKPTTKQINRSQYGTTGLIRDEIKYKLGSIECTVDKAKIVSGNRSGNKMVFKNPWMTQQLLDRLYNKYRDLSFYPYELTWRGDIDTEPGDWISVYWGEENTRFDIPVFSHHIIFDGGLSSKTNAKESGQSQSQYKYRGPVQEKLDYIESLTTKIGRLYLDEAEPLNPKEGDKWMKPSGGYAIMYERVDGQWIRKVDTADLNKIIDTLTTDEVIAKKLSAGLVQSLEINARQIVAGSLDLNRISITNGSKPILEVRDGKIFFDVSSVDDFTQPIKKIEQRIEAKADKGITEEQLKHLQDQQLIMMQELQAKATMDTVLDWQAKYEAFVKANEEEKQQAQIDLVSLSERMVGVQQDLGSMTAAWNAIDRNMKFGNEGLSIGNPQGDSSILVSDNRISMMSGGKEVMSISQGVIHIDNGVFTKSIQIGYYVESQYVVNPKYNVIRYVGP